ncbi:MAG: non-canonical purine NTP pyrophosphatase [Planctomycetota bacterium]
MTTKSAPDSTAGGRALSIVAASHNPGKVAELRCLLEPLGLVVVAAADSGVPVPDETADTFIGNAKLKAEAAMRATGLPAIADDAGLEVASLGGAPGVHSARWGGSSRDFRIAIQRVLEAMKAADGCRDRAASLTCGLCVCWPDGRIYLAEGRLQGHIATQPRGRAGNGYDPIFVPLGFAATLAEAPPMDPPVMPHRLAAFAQLPDGAFLHER